MTYTINETTYSEGEHQQMHNLIIKYADANLKEYRGCGDNKIYWRGVRDTYQAVLNDTYGNDWAVHGSIGYYVFVLSQDYITAKDSAKEYQLKYSAQYFREKYGEAGVGDEIDESILPNNLTKANS